jgi:hypothetical protein
MASLLQAMGLGSSSGTPTTLSDDELQALQAQQDSQGPTSGVSALMGVDAGNAPAQPAAQDAPAASPSLLSSVAQGDTSSTGSDSNPSYATKSQTDQSASSGDAGASADNSDNTDTSANAGTGSDSNPSYDSAATDPSSASTADSSAADTTATTDKEAPGFFAKLLAKAKSDPSFGEALMNAGFSMMANTRYGTPGLAAVGMGAQTGVQTYNALKQQGIANQMAQYQAQNKASLDQADISSKNATTQSTQLGNASKVALSKYAQAAGGNFNITDAIAAGALPQDAISAYQGMHPSMTMTTDDAGNVYAFNPQTGTQSRVGSSVKIANTAAGTTSTAYTGGGANGTPVVPQVVQQGGLAPAEVSAAAAKYQAPEAAATKNSAQQGQFLNQLQSADALAGSGGGVLGAGYRAAQAKLGVNDPNSQLRQQFASTNVQGIMSALPSGSRMDQNFLQQMEKTIADPQTATPEQMIRATSLIKSKADFDSVDNSARAAFVNANGGMETPLSKATTITVGGQSMNVPAKTTMQQVADAATQKLVNWDPPLINPQWGDGKSQAQINQALAFTKPADIAKLRSQGILLPSNMRTGGQ